MPEKIELASVLSQLSATVQQQMAKSTKSTCIWLPTRAPDLNLDISQRFDSATLLFLRKIRDVSIEEAGFRRRVWVASNEDTLTDGLCISRVRIQDLNEPSSSSAVSATRPATLQWTTVKRTVACPAEFGGRTTEVALAFPDSSTLEPQQVFAYLPVCGAGFPFAIQANWSLVSSRQQVHQNEW